MAAGSSAALIRDVQSLFDSGTASGLSDQQLLERFADRRDASGQAAFEVLVLRHGPMVLRVCRNVLTDPNDAQDAFQATFLVLVRRSRSVRGLESLGGWLYGVACRVAARARVEASRRRVVEQRAALRVVEAIESTTDDAIDHGEHGPIVQEEVRRLPLKYRAVVVLCYWQGLTQEQAAAQLGCPLGTVRSRLARARELLRRRLTRRGLAPLVGHIGMALDPGSHSAVLRLAPVPPELVHSTISAAEQIAAGVAARQVVSGAVASLVHGMLWSMSMIKFSSFAKGVVLIGLAGYGVGLAAQRAGRSPSAQVAIRSPGRAAPDGPLAQALPETSKKPGQQNQQGKTAGSHDIYCIVEGQTTIIKILPEGSPVKKGQVICELDSANLRDQLVNQRIVVSSAEASYQIAKLTREVAEVAAIEYAEGDYRIKLGEVDGDIQLAQAELALAEDELNAAKVQNAPLSVKRAELAVLRARLALERAQSRRRLLVDYTKGRRMKELRSNLEKARSDELTKGAIWELQKSKEQNLKKQIVACTLVAPIDGIFQYVHRPRPHLLDPDFGEIREGASVREHQLLFQIVPADQ
jgi:RNA polymerase sigma factor (sigma-70 family)